MKTRMTVWIAGLAMLMCGAQALGQVSQGDLPAAKLVERVKASDIDTKKFKTQIDDKYVFGTRRPRNPMQMPELPGVPNELVPGGMGDYSRISDARKWPAIDKTGWVPPDPDLAVGKNHIVAVVNSSLAFFTKTGTKQFQQTSETFFAGLGAGSFQYDPKVIYDRVHERFVVLYLEEDDASTTSKLLIAVSDDDNPNGTWHRYRIEAKLTVGSNNFWLDYPGFGYNKDAYAVCGNMFGFTDGWAGVQFLVMPSAAMLSGGTAAVYSLRDPAAGSVQIAEVIDPDSPNIFAVARAGTSALRIFAIKDAGTTTPSVTFTTTAVPTFSTPGFGAPSTNGRTLDSLDGRIFNVVVRNSHMLAGHCIQSGSMLVSRWYDVNLGTWPDSGNPSLVQSGNVGSADVHYFSPAVNINAAGQIGMIFSGSSSTVPADMIVAGRLPTDPLGEMGTPIILENSDGNNYGAGRWGDYFGVDVDPVDDSTFWGIAMGIDSSSGWKTSIFSWVVTSTFPDVASLTIDPASVSGTAGSTGTVTLTDIAPAGGMKVKLKTSNPKVASVPGLVVVPNGQTTATFAIKTLAQTSPKTATITATGGKTSDTADITVNEMGIRSLTLNPSTVSSGLSTTGTVELGGPAPAGGALVRIAVDKPNLATVDWSLLIPAGQTTGQFPIGTVPVGSLQTVVVRAANPGPTVYATLTLTPNLGLSGIAVSPSVVKGGRSTRGTLYLTAAAPQNLTIVLSSDGGSALRIPVSVTIRKGAKTATFSISTAKTSSKKTATISATYGGVVQSTIVTINP